MERTSVIIVENHWILYIPGILMLFYSIIMCVLKKPVSRKITVNIRRVYYSCYLLGTAYMFNLLSPEEILSLGRNKLGIAEELWLFLIALLIGFITDTLVISAVAFKEIAFGNTKLQIAEDDLVQHVKSQVDLTNDLTQKIISYYNMVQNLGKYVDSIMNKIKNNTVDIFKEYQDFLSAYFSYQKEQEIDEDKGLRVDIIEMNQSLIKNEYKLADKEYKKLKEQTEVNQTYFTQKGKNQYMFIPYKSVIFDYDTVLIVMSSKKPMVKVEQYIMIVLMQQLEERLIYRFHQKTKSLKKNGSGYYYKLKETNKAGD